MRLGEGCIKEVQKWVYTPFSGHGRPSDTGGADILYPCRASAARCRDVGQQINVENGEKQPAENLEKSEKNLQNKAASKLDYLPSIEEGREAQPYKARERDG